MALLNQVQQIAQSINTSRQECCIQKYVWNLFSYYTFLSQPDAKYQANHVFCRNADSNQQNWLQKAPKSTDILLNNAIFFHKF